MVNIFMVPPPKKKNITAYYKALQCSTMHYKYQHVNALQRSAFQCIAKISNSLHYKDQPVIPLHRSLLQCIAKVSISMHCKDQQFTALQRSACQSITQIIIAMHCKDKHYKDQHDNVLQRSAFHLHYKD